MGDSQTQPVAGAFDDSEFSKERGFDMLVLRDSMTVVWTSTHGTTAGNENLTGADVLAAVQQELAGD
ncbi:MAG: hypothetical protein AB8H79_24090 [Myxococcota bacterium]